jgi:hypothetical protein
VTRIGFQSYPRGIDYAVLLKQWSEIKKLDQISHHWQRSSSAVAVRERCPAGTRGKYDNVTHCCIFTPTPLRASDFFVRLTFLV